MSISATIKSVQDIMRQDAGVDGDAQRISQLVWMLFLKVFDSKEKEWDAISDNYYNSILISLHYYPENQGKRAPKARTRKPRNQITTNA